MRFHAKSPHSLEILEARIAPAAAGVVASIAEAERAYDLDPIGNQNFVSAKTETPLLLKAGQILTTGVGARSGAYLLFVEHGEALIFTSDFNNNKIVDFNEITGIAAGAGLRMVSFIDINGDIVTNLDADRTLTDSNNSTIGDDPFLRGDGRLLNNVSIEKIELRSLAITDLTDQNANGVVDDADISLRLALSSYSIHGNILVGAGFGIPGDANSGLIIDDAGRQFQTAEFDGVPGTHFFIDFIPTIGSIRTGSAASGEYFSFSLTAANDIQGTIRTFTPLAGQVGGDISTVRAADATTPFNIHGVFAGDGGVGARGGNIDNVQLSSDNAGGYSIIAGNGGSGRTGGAGGSITNFSDAGSVTSQVVIKTGNGGTGTAAAGGNGGVLDLVVPGSTAGAVLNLNGGVSITTGSGGDGFTIGGNGASLLRGVVTTPEGTGEYGRNIIGSSHDGAHDIITGRLTETGIIGRTKAVDFDGDGLGDIVFTTSEAEQLVVQFGDGQGGWRADPITGNPVRLYLDAPIDAEALTVGDFNGDGHQDIATASSAGGAFGGVFVFLNRYEDANVNGLSSEEDVNRNGVDDFIGFYSSRQSPLPSLNVGDPDAGPFFNFQFAYYHSAHAINDIETGDFDGDGYTDIAIVATYIEKPPTAGGPLAQVLIFMRPDVEDGRPTGEFYANFGSKAIAQPPQGANPFLPFVPLNDGSLGGGKGIIESTALSTAATHDVIVAAAVQNSNQVGGLTEAVIRNFVEIYDNFVPGLFGPTLVNTIAFTVDANRDVGGDKINIVGASLRDFTTLDFDNDGRTDFAAVTEEPAGFLVAARGDGAGDATVVTQNFSTPDQRGFFFGPRNLNIGTEQRAIRVTDADLDGRFDEVAILDYGVPGFAFRVDEIQITTPPRNNVVLANPGGIVENLVVSNFASGKDPEVIAWDLYFPTTAGTAGQYAVSLARKPSGFIDSAGFAFPFNFLGNPLSEHYLTFDIGDGGDALIGRGGNGGSLGTDLAVVGIDLFGSVNVTLPANRFFNGLINFDAGQGGTGFTKGGNGGGISGVVVRYPANTQGFHSEVNLHAGSGGIGVAAAGGDGGTIRSISVETGVEILAGNGGPGLTGGNGGSILGNGLVGFFDNRDTFQVMNAGNGGNGIRGGGNGGSVLNFKGAFNLGFAGDSAGLIQYVAGNGGTASSGPGGNGGSVRNVSPLQTVTNLLGGDILLQAGNGGNGSAGGDGGSVANFINNPTGAENPAVLSVIAGSGGRGVSGAGGDGGSVSDIKTPTRGILNALSLPATVYGFNRILGGNGGLSAGGVGGTGGSVSAIDSKNDENPFVLVAGAGGAGLTVGGNGGSVFNARVSVGGSTFAKAVFIAGDGGTASAFIPNPIDQTLNQGQKAFGGRVGQGGQGGDIIAVSQFGGIASRGEFIAGNGGDTVNYGTIADQTTGRFVGEGGLVRNIIADGTIGNILPGIAIKSYNDIRNGESMTDFITENLRDPLSPGSVDDSFGNVGIVVGAAGRLKEGFGGYSISHVPIFDSNPAFRGLNGTLSNIVAREIMSAVAGSVERIAAIQMASDFTILSGARIGTNKTVGDPVDYRDKDGNPVPFPVIDGQLLDGALIVSKQPTKNGNSFNYPGNVFVIS